MMVVIRCLGAMTRELGGAPSKSPGFLWSERAVLRLNCVNEDSYVRNEHSCTSCQDEGNRPPSGDVDTLGELVKFQRDVGRSRPKEE